MLSVSRYYMCCDCFTSYGKFPGNTNHLLLCSVGLTASCFGLGATLSNYLGQMIVEHFGHVVSLTGSFFLSIVPILLFSTMPETYGRRCGQKALDIDGEKSYQTFSV